MIVDDPVVEEDWSSHIKDFSLNGFAEHALEVLELPDGQSIRLRCVKALTPFDMINLYNGAHDATGHRIWMGALFFAQAFPSFKRSLFQNRRVMELGSGTGFGGIALFVLSQQAKCTPKELVLTDADPTALDLCRWNCDINTKCDDRITVRCLDWSDGEFSSGGMFDTIIGTDVVYDVSVVIPLLSTVSACLSIDGMFMLSHIPRASLPGMSKIASTAEMENYITEAASKYSLRLMETVRPMDLPKTTPKHLEAISLMHDAGAAILLFAKEERKVNADGLVLVGMSS